jgi:dTDP-4-amino-4,6-dideoxygalactose transaminase
MPDMYSYRLPRAAPYWSGATYRAILDSLVSGSVTDGSAISGLRSVLIETLGVEDALLCGSGSLALEVALRACGVGQDDEVILPAFCCSAVVPPILAVGALPVLADVGEELNIAVETVDAAITRKTKAIIVPHLFGNPADMGPIVELARSKNIRVIDDAAQALGATIDGQPAGSFGDAGIFSFGREKICFGLGGGALVSRDETLSRRILLRDLAPPALWPPLGELLSILIWHRWRRWTAPLSKIRSSSRSAGPGAPAKPYRRESVANLNAAVAASLMETLGENIAARRARVHAYQKLLRTEERLALIPHRPGSACLVQVVRVLPRSRGQDFASEVVETLATEGYEVQGSYVPIHLLGNIRGCVWDRLPYSERVWPDLVELPCEPGVSLEDIERIAAIVRRVVAGQ